MADMLEAGGNLSIIWRLGEYKYAMWWPWLKNYHGEWDKGILATESYLLNALSVDSVIAIYEA